MFTEFCTYLEEMYGGSHSIIESNGFSFLFIKNENDEFKVNLTDKVRFGKYTLFHRNSGRHLDGVQRYHIQLKAWDLSYVLFSAYSHKFNKNNGIFSCGDDYKRFLYDWKRYVAKRIKYA